MNPLLVASGVVLLLGLMASGRGAREALWVAWPVALMIVPTWMTVRFISLTIDARAALGAVAAVLLATRGGAGPGRRFVAADAVVAGMFLSEIVSALLNGELRPLTTPSLARTYLPYVVGRMYLGSETDIARAARPFALACLAIAALTAFECVSKVNVLQVVTGRRFSLLERGQGYRMGLRRAQGNVEHPIMMGNLLVLTLPWVLVLARSARFGIARPGWRLGPWIQGAGLIGTLSRGPILGGVAAAAGSAFFRRPRLRVPLALAGAGALAFSFMGGDDLVSALSESVDDQEQTIVIGDQEYTYSGTRHRLLLYEIYGQQMAEAGLFGLGGDRGKSDLEEGALNKFWSIDNHYIGIVLARGYLYTALFALLVASCAWTLGRLGLGPEGPRAWLAGDLAAALASVALVLFTVYMSASFGAAFYFAAGLAGNLRSLPSEDPSCEPPPSA